MPSAKQQKNNAKTKPAPTEVKDLRPSKDAKGGGTQKKEGPGLTTVTGLT